MVSTQRRGVRFEERDPNTRRYFDPKDGRWTHPLPSSPSQERFYTRSKGFLADAKAVQQRYGKLAIYANPKLKDSKNPDPFTQAADKARALDGPFPTGERDSECNSHRGSEACKTWNDHYNKMGLVFDHWIDEEKKVDRNFTTDDIEAFIEVMNKQGYEVKKKEEDKEDADKETVKT